MKIGILGSGTSGCLAPSSTGPTGVVGGRLPAAEAPVIGATAGAAAPARGSSALPPPRPPSGASH
jgi:hypothetical protein